MSFAYIDSQGKEVSIPGPDALRLRIELGAITDSTQFYDAGADRWAPAADHEIYRQLKRDIASSQSSGFVAPPPSAPDAFADSGPLIGQTPSDGMADELDGILDVEESEADPTAEDLLYPEGASADEINDGMEGFTLSASVASTEPGGTSNPRVDESGAEAGDDPDEDEGVFDFGAEALVLEEPEEDEEGENDEEDGDEVPQTELAGVPFGDDPGGDPPVGSAEEEGPDTPDFGMAFEGGSPDDDFGDAPEEEDDEEALQDESDAAAAPSGRENDPYDRTIRERRGPRSRPPRRPGEGSGASRAVLGAVAVVVVVAIAGVVVLGGDDDQTSAPPEEVVVLPELAPELEPELRDLTLGASESMVAELDSLPQRLALAPQPGSQWLSAAYLASASAFVPVREYWEGFDALLDEMIEVEGDLWTAAFEQALDSAGLPAASESQLRARGLAGWAAAAPERQALHDRLRAVIDASLRLHDFLVANEASITYDPSGAGSAEDPVEAAVPATPALGDEMWSRVGEITVALDELGYLAQVETEPLFDLVTSRLVEIGIR